MKKTKLGKWIFVVPVIAIILFSFYYASNNKQDNDVLNSDEKIPAVLLEEAIKQNISVSEKDVDNAIKVLIKQANMTEEQYYSFVSTKYPNLDEFKAKIKDNLKIIKLINENINWSVINVTDEDVDKFIDENKEMMPIEQLKNDSVFKEKFYKLAKQQLFQKRQQQLINEYVSEILEKNLEK